ncbi:MAG: ribbon-helix-helix domain-containing protein [Candidatus Aerophobetes bacterium]
MVRPWVELEKDQYERLKELQENTGKAVSEMIRQAIASFVTRKDYSISMGSSHLPKTTREDYRGVTAYFHRSDWNLLEKISKGTGTCKTGLIREAVDEYMTELLRALD